MLVFDPIPSRDIIRVTNYKPSNCWDVMNCPKDLRKECWAYRLNSSKECWIVREKAHKEFSWKNLEGCNNCDFYDYISVQNIRRK